MKTQTQTLRKVFMWYEVKKLSDYSDSMVAKKLGPRVNQQVQFSNNFCKTLF
jgi:hypothetical protein